MWHEFQSTDRMSYLFEAITLPMCKIIHRVDTPFFSCSMMIGMFNSINNRIAHQHISMHHINFSPKDFAPVSKITVFHFFKKHYVFNYFPTSKRTILTRCCWSTFHVSNLLRSRVIYIGKPFFY